MRLHIEHEWLTTWNMIVRVYEVDEDGHPVRLLGKAITNDIEHAVSEILKGVSK